ncbi:MAG: hypothetical protein ABII90_05695 [Bacteroidota bacterium]
MNRYLSNFLSVLAILLVVTLLILTCSCGSKNNKSDVGYRWDAPVILSTNRSGNAIRPYIDIDKSGNALAVWQQSDNGTNNIYANYYTQETGWQGAKRIENFDTRNGQNPKFTFNNSGEGTAIWSQFTGTDGNNIVINDFSVEDGFVPENATRIDTVPNSATTIRGNPAEIFYHGDRRIAVWNQYDYVDAGNFQANTPLIFSAIESTEGMWGDSMIVNEYTSYDENTVVNAGFLDVAISETSSVCATWTEFRMNDFGTGTVVIARYDEDYGWNDWTYLTDYNTHGSAAQKKIEYIDDEYAILVWQDFFGSNLFYSLYDHSTDIWSNPISIKPGTATNTATNPEIAKDGFGNIMVIWTYRSDDYSYVPQTRSYLLSNNSWEEPDIHLEEETSSVRPYIAMDGEGNALASWGQTVAPYSSDPDFNYARQLYSRVYNNNSGWQQVTNHDQGNNAEIFDSYLADDTANSMAKFDSEGNAMLIWTVWDGELIKIYAQRLIKN